ncbi:glycosyltransferase [Acidithiobacillus ferrivorans]|uniref:glycosyltransferase n=1 Tax=Acidithiobacillus ferrivorans TaxID=160808 RepID=UPI00020D137E|nr:glycosyltransferase [Acidithiobacillus ferrivorans]
MRRSRPRQVRITLLGFADAAVLRDYLQRARAFVFAAEEDFGIAPLEAQACGTPIIAFSKGGALETIIPLPEAECAASAPAPTGVFFYEQSVAAIIAAVERFEGAGACGHHPGSLPRKRPALRSGAFPHGVHGIRGARVGTRVRQLISQLLDIAYSDFKTLHYNSVSC